MVQVTATQDSILDVRGELLQGDAALFLKTLDRLLTVGSYYSEDHHQYLGAVEKSCAALVGAIAPRDSLAMEITSAGVLILGQEVDSGQLHVRKLFDLLVPLNLARLEFQAGLTPEDLRATLAALKAARRQLETKEGFREVVVSDLPPSVSIATRHVTNSGGSREGDSLLDGLLEEMVEESASRDDADPEQVRERLAVAFLELAEELVGNLETVLQQSEGPGKTEFQTSITQAELVAIRDGLKRMVEARPDPEELLNLISNAKTAVDLSGDPSTVDLAFKVLREQMGAVAKPRMQAHRLILEEEPGFSTEILKTAVTELEDGDEPVVDVETSARRDQMRIATTLLALDFQDMEQIRALELVEGVLESPQCGRAEMPLVAECALVLADPENESGHDLLPPLFRLLRELQFAHLAGFWGEILESAGQDERSVLWPHLMNDLMLGFGAEAQLAATTLWGRAAQVSMGRAREALATLKLLPAFQSSAPEPELGPLMTLPVEQALPVHAVLLKNRFADRHGARLFKALQHQPCNDLTRILVAALEDYTARHRKLLFALICEADLETPSPRLAQVAGELLGGLLRGLPRERRCEPWVTEAIALLPSLLGDEAWPVLERICKRRRLLILRAWPEASRRVAAAYLHERSSHGQ